MRIKDFDNILKYLPVLLLCLYIGYLGRDHFINKGADDFAVNLIFWFYFGFAIIGFATLNIFLDPIVNWTVKRFLNNSKSKLVEKQEAEPKDIQIVSSTEKIANPVENNADTNVIRKAQQEKKTQQDQEKLQIALNYTKQKFALYVSDEDLKVLCDYIILYSEKQSFEHIQLVKIKELSTLDLYHFGWNLWNHFKIGQQIEIASFLKHLFAESLKEVEIDTIKSHLKDDPKKGLITIKESLSD
ncbi:hypothetical protein [Chryseobacterium sp. SC28]|uniref:hypothetical protein n=1 Tax=Chryseobacterium sp. SC28 TaxID=2268028 RepID=UPI000F6553EB|nr:hypothetical protein [Chryseobacterium sp. SC28]RRQ46321.1 hypothetical protein DTW91_05215 [Chryseobacterium sp. SC28]